jgi:hypothetical protein
MDQREKDQHNFVRNMLSSCSSWKMKKVAIPEGKTPASVARARRVIASYNKKQERKAARIEKNYSRLYADVRRELYFGSVKKALKMAESLLRRCGE